MAAQPQSATQAVHELLRRIRDATAATHNQPPFFDATPQKDAHHITALYGINDRAMVQQPGGAVERDGEGQNGRPARSDDTRRTGLYRAKFKTQLCHNMVLTGACAFGDGCAFAHSPWELRPEAEMKKKTSPRNSKLASSIMPLLKGTGSSEKAASMAACAAAFATPNPAPLSGPSLRTANTTFPLPIQQSIMSFSAEAVLFDLNSQIIGQRNDLLRPTMITQADEHLLNRAASGLIVSEEPPAQLSCENHTDEHQSRRTSASEVSHFILTEPIAEVFPPAQTAASPVRGIQHQQPHRFGQPGASIQFASSTSIQSLSSSGSTASSSLTVHAGLSSDQAANPVSISKSELGQNLDLLRAVLFHIESMDHELTELKCRVLEIASQLA